MKLSLIGMSNSGKTYWSKKLEKIGFQRFSCDDYIEKKLGDKLDKLGYFGIRDVSRWMGQPYDKQYSKNSRIYLRFETDSLEKFLQLIKKNSLKRNMVIDTTGSVIYTDNKLLTELRKYTKVLYLDTPKSVQEEMYRSYLKNPKPVIWGEIYKKRNGESDTEALKRCYPYLMDYRTKKYQEIAHLTLDYFRLRSPNFTVEDFLKIIRD